MKMRIGIVSVETALDQIASLDWFVTHLTQIHSRDWMAQAMSTGCNPLVGYHCDASGVTIEAALVNLLAKLENGFDLVPPPTPLATNSTAPALMDLLKLPSAPAIPHISRRI